MNLFCNKIMSELQVCRFCAKQMRMNIAVENILNSPLRQELKHVLQFLNASDIDLEDQSLPFTICNICLKNCKLLKEACVFLDMTRQSQVLLRKQASDLKKLSIALPSAPNNIVLPLKNVPNLNNSPSVNYAVTSLTTDVPKTMDSRLQTYINNPREVILPFNLNYNAHMPLLVIAADPTAVVEEGQQSQEDPLCGPTEIKSENAKLELSTDIKTEIPDETDIEFPEPLIDVKIESADSIETDSVIESEPIVSPKCTRGRPKKIKPPELSDTTTRKIMYGGVPLYENQESHLSKTGHVKSWTDLSLHCRLCTSNKKPLSSFRELREHSKERHKQCNALYCASCNIGFDYFKEFTDHMMSHFEELKLLCPYCNIQLESDEDCLQHLQLHKEVERACLQCGEQFKTDTLLDAHKQSFKVKEFKKKKRQRWIPFKTEVPDTSDESWTGYKWSCLDCEDIFLNVESLRQHSQEIHMKCYNMKCVDCSVVSDGYAAFVLHVRRHRPYLKNYCHYCNYKYKTMKEETYHVFQHFDYTILKNCDCCGQIFASSEELQQHRDLYKPKQPKPLKYKKRERPLTVEDLTCQVCKKISKNLDTLRCHKKSHISRHKDHTCDICGKAYFTHQQLKIHSTSSHALSRDFVCNICKSAFPSKDRLKKHIVCHSDEKPFECDQCQKRFRLRKQLGSHMLVHTDEKPFRCPLCEKSFRYMSNYKTHQYQHTGARPYQCTECHMDFTNMANCNKHMRRRHGMSRKQAAE